MNKQQPTLDNNSNSDGDITSQEQTPPTRKALLSELESIKNLLNDNGFDQDELDSDDLDIDIPILEDVVGDGPVPADTASDLLDIKAIFDDELGDTTESDEALYPEETQLNFEGLDTSVEIPSFKLSLNSVTIHSPTELLDEELEDDTQPEMAEPTDAAVLPSQDADDEQCLESEQLEIISSEPEMPLLEGLLMLDEPEELIADDEEVDRAEQRPAPAAATATASSPLTPSDFDLELTVQELVDEMVPLIEDKLRQRLSSLPEDLVLQLADRYLKD